MNHKQIEVPSTQTEIEKESDRRPTVVLSKDRRPAKNFNFDKTLALLALRMLMFLPNKDFIILPH